MHEFYKKHLKHIEIIAWMIACLLIIVAPNSNASIIFALIGISTAIDNVHFKIMAIEKQIEDALHMISIIEAAAVATDMRTADMQSDS